MISKHMSENINNHSNFGKKQKQKQKNFDLVQLP